MENIIMMEALRNYFLECPFLDEFAKLGIEYLPNDPTNYSLEEVPVKRIIKEYIDGSSERQFSFIFASREFYASDEIRQNIENSGFYQKFADWLESNTEDEIFPDFGDGKTVIKIEAQSSGYLFSVDSGLTNARYQIQCRVIYEQIKGGK